MNYDILSTELYTWQGETVGVTARALYNHEADTATLMMTLRGYEVAVTEGVLTITIGDEDLDGFEMRVLASALDRAARDLVELADRVEALRESNPHA
jgi:hypothetical protein